MKNILTILCLTLSFTISYAQSAKPDYLLDGSLMRSELVKKDILQQKAIFASLTPESCYQLWVTKFADNLRSDNLEKGEKAVMRFLYDFISPDVYAPSTTEAKETFKNIIETAKDILQQFYDWPPSKIYRYLYTFMTEEEIEEYNTHHKDTIR